MTSILSITTKIERKLQSILRAANKGTASVNVYLNSQNYATYPCYIIRIKEAKAIPIMPASYEINFDITLLDHNECDITSLLEKALVTITKANLQLNGQINNTERILDIPTALEVFNLECKCVKWGQGQDLISSSVTIHYTCSITHKVTEESLLSINQLTPSLN